MFLIIYVCLNSSFWFVIYRHLYVADLFDHNVHVLERKEDNSVASVKVKFRYLTIHSFFFFFFSVNLSFQFIHI